MSNYVKHRHTSTIVHTIGPNTQPTMNNRVASTSRLNTLDSFVIYITYRAIQPKL